MGWYDVGTKEALYDPNGTEVHRRHGIYGGAYGLAMMVRGNLLKEAGVTDPSGYSMKYSTGPFTEWEEVAAKDPMYLDPAQYFAPGDKVLLDNYHKSTPGTVLRIEGFEVVVLTEDGEKKVDSTFLKKAEQEDLV